MTDGIPLNVSLMERLRSISTALPSTTDLAPYDLSAHPRVTGVDKDLECFAGKDLSNFANGGNPNGFKVGGKGTCTMLEPYCCLAVWTMQQRLDQNNATT